MRFPALLLALGIPCLAQTTLDPQAYASFLGMVSSQRFFASMPRTSGIPAPKLPELTPDETEKIGRIADDYRSNLYRIIGSFPRREMIYQLVELGGVKEELADLAKHLEQQRLDLVTSHVRQLKETLGDDRFQLVTAWLEQPENSRLARPFPPFIEPGTKIIPAGK